MIGLLLSIVWWSAPALGAPSETQCENAKLRAAASYNQCLSRAFRSANRLGGEPSLDAIDRCDQRFDEAFERAEAEGGCRTPGGSSTLRNLVRQQASLIATTTIGAGLCAQLSIIDKTAVCQVLPYTDTLDLGGIVEALADYGVTADTVMWISAWGGNGGTGACVSCPGGSQELAHGAAVGGLGGFAQTFTTLADIESAYGTTILHYYMGVNGVTAPGGGASGGTATLVTANDLNSTEVHLETTLLVAGGGGGAGAYFLSHNNVYDQFALAGGDAAVASASTDANKIVAGGYSGDDDAYAEGGQINRGGKGFEQGDGPIAPLGAPGDPGTTWGGFWNQTGTTVGGQGGGIAGGCNISKSDGAGGGGGGGYTGGGGWTLCDQPSIGGGGGSSFAVGATATCTGVPNSRQWNPNVSQGFVQVGFDLGICQWSRYPHRHPGCRLLLRHRARRILSRPPALPSASGTIGKCHVRSLQPPLRRSWRGAPALRHPGSSRARGAAARLAADLVLLARGHAPAGRALFRRRSGSAGPRRLVAPGRRL